MPLNQCPAVGEACARHTVQRQQQQQQQPSALAALHEASHGDGVTFRQPRPAGERRINTHTCSIYKHKYELCLFSLQITFFPKISTGHAQNSTFPLQRTNAQHRTMGERLRQVGMAVLSEGQERLIWHKHRLQRLPDA